MGRTPLPRPSPPGRRLSLVERKRRAEGTLRPRRPRRGSAASNPTHAIASSAEASRPTTRLEIAGPTPTTTLAPGPGLGRRTVARADAGGDRRDPRDDRDRCQAGKRPARIALQPEELGHISIHLSQTSEGLLARSSPPTRPPPRHSPARALSSTSRSFPRRHAAAAGHRLLDARDRDSRFAGDPRRRAPPGSVRGLRGTGERRGRWWSGQPATRPPRRPRGENSRRHSPDRHEREQPHDKHHPNCTCGLSHRCSERQHDRKPERHPRSNRLSRTDDPLGCRRRTRSNQPIRQQISLDESLQFAQVEQNDERCNAWREFSGAVH